MNTVFALSLLSGELQVRGRFAQELLLRVGLVALALAALVAVGVLYAKEVGRLGVGRRLLLAGVRMAAVVAVAFLLLRPVWVAETSGQKRRPVAVLIDVSESMNSKDPRPNLDDQWRVAVAFEKIDPDKVVLTEPITSLKGSLPDKPKRIEIARAALTNPKIDLFAKLREVGPLEVSTFGATRSGRDTLSTDWVKTLTADQSRTAMVTANANGQLRADAGQAFEQRCPSFA